MTMLGITTLVERTPQGLGTFNLPVSIVTSPYFERKHFPDTTGRKLIRKNLNTGRDIKLISVLMKALVGQVAELKDDIRVVSLNSVYFDSDSVPIEVYNFDVNYDETVTESLFQGLIITEILNHALSQSYSMTEGDVLLFSIAARSQGTRSFANPSRTLNSAFQISTTRDAEVSYAVDIACASTLVAGQKGKVTLQYADDSGFTTNVVSLTESETGTGALLGLATNNTSALPGIIPAGKYVRLATTNVVGTPTFTFRRSQEVLL